MIDSEIKGIYCYSNKSFYYLEKNDLFTISDLDRIKNTLIARELIKITDGSSLAGSYKIMTLEEAKLENINIEIIYLSKHIRNIINKQQESKSSNMEMWD